MFDQKSISELLRGERQGFCSSLARGLLRLGEFPYAAAVAVRNFAFDRQWRKVHRVGVPVISIGNLTVGGTGKTPVVAWLAKLLLERGSSPAIVSRGYHAIDETNDEARELAQQCPDVAHVQNADRVAAARQAIDTFGAKAILLDDGFQHRRLARDLDIALIDALNPFGYEHLLPRGLLREPTSALQRADMIILTRADLVSAERRSEIKQRCMAYNPRAAWGEVAFLPSDLLGADGSRRALDSLSGKRVAAFCGIGNPAGFRATLAQRGINVVAWNEYPDHHHYSAEDCASLVSGAKAVGAEVVLCTHKDLVKIDWSADAAPLWAVTVKAEFLAGEVELDLLIDRVLAIK